jgi:predicted metalloprotease
MRWEEGRRSDNVEDRRGMRVRGPVAIGGGGLLVIVLLMALCGRDPTGLLQVLSQMQGTDTVSVDNPGALPGSPGMPGGAQDTQADFVRVVLASTEDTWSRLFETSQSSYRSPTLVLFTDMVESACGFSSAAVGPFYCPGDEKLYIDLGFYDELRDRFGAPGDFAQAYVIAHEIGHHVQKILGISDQVSTLQERSPRQANALSVKLELQADCFAGIWAHHAAAHGRLLEAGDIEEGLRAAAAIGDDRMQRMAGRYVSPESFTHGSSEQRVSWLRRGLQTGSVDACDTFSRQED